MPKSSLYKMAMAPNIVPDLQPPRSTSRDPTSNLRNPLPLSAKQEAEVRDIYYKKVRAQCADEIKTFAKCAKGRTVTLAWACKAEQFQMNSCMIAHATGKAEDEAREEWFVGIQERRRKRVEELEQVEVRRREVVEMTRRQEEKERREAEGKSGGELGVKEKALEAEGRKGWWR